MWLSTDPSELKMYSQKGGGPGVVNGRPGVSKEEPLVAGSPPGEDELITENEHVPFILRYITLISRLFGIITLTGIVFDKCLI